MGIVCIGIIFFVTAFIVIGYLDYKTYVMKEKREIMREYDEEEEKVE